MSDGIVNRVEASGIVHWDAAVFARVPEPRAFDLAELLEGGLVLREAAFRQALKELPMLEGTVVALFCSADAVVPDWAWMLAAVALQDCGAEVRTGRPDAVRRELVLEAIDRLMVAGVTVVAAAGNDTGLKVSVPANCPGVIAVSGVRHIGSKVGYSNIGPEVALAAPAGNCVNLQGTCLYPLLTTINLGQRQAGANGYSDGSDYSVSPGSNLQGPATGKFRVLRGGSWSNISSFVRSAFRLISAPDDWSSVNGFRCARSQ